jgi:hypothetical protein
MSIVPCATTAAAAAAAITNATSERETTGIGARIRALCPFRLAKGTSERPPSGARPSGAMRRTNVLMNKRARVLRAILRGIARVQRTFTIEIGPLRASGVPAILVGVTGIVLASGVTAALAKGASRLPETLGEARNLADALNAGSPRLKS